MAKAKADEAVELVEKALEAISSAEEAVKSAWSLCNASEAESLLAAAREAYGEEDFGEARRLAEQARAVAEDEAGRAREALNAISAAEEAVKAVKGRYGCSGGAEALLEMAREAFKQEEYEEAVKLAEKAVEATRDVDGDGVPNDVDIVPTVKNVYVYAVLGVTGFVVAVLVIARVRSRKYRRHKEGVLELIDEIIGEGAR